MYKTLRKFVLRVDATNRFVGRLTLYLVFVMMGVLLFSAIMRFFFNSPILWAVEFSEFVLSAYITLGGGFALLMGAHVRMDVFYSKWRWRRQARVDLVTSTFLLIYLGLLFFGCICSAKYSIVFNQHNNSAWGPALAPIKCIMGVGIFLTILQAISETIKAYYKSRGLIIHPSIPEALILDREVTVEGMEGAGGDGAQTGNAKPDAPASTSSTQG